MGKVAAVVLAAGKGTRMKSEKAKVLFPLAGRPMLQHIVDILIEIGVDDIYTVVGYEAGTVQASIAGPITWVEQREQLGTGHALAQAAAYLGDFPGVVLVLAGDIPLITGATLKELLTRHAQEGNAATVLSARVPDPTGYGRVVRSADGRLKAIVEEKDADDRQRQVDEINSAIYCFDWGRVGALMSRLGRDNAQGEYYLTEIISLLAGDKGKLGIHVAADHREVMGINDRVQLAQAEKILRRRICHKLMREGVSVLDPDSTWIDADVRIARDTTILPNTQIKGQTTIGGNSVIGPSVTIQASALGEGVCVQYAVLEGATVEDGVSVGPFAYLRPGAVVGRQAKIGDFVEIKNSRIGPGTKVPHLAYVGDAEVGANSNIGCGVITANYDGASKQKTTIGDGVFIGSNANLVAPVRVGDNAYVAAGSTVTEDVPPRALAIARTRQTNKADWRKKE